jgi:hypothetical protein
VGANENELEDGYSALLSSGPQSTPPAKEKEETTWKPSCLQPRDKSFSKLLLHWPSFEKSIVHTSCNTLFIF